MPRPPRPVALASAQSAPNDRRRVLEAAKRALGQNDFKRAQQLLAGPLRAQADDPAMLGLAALAHRGLGDLLGALSLFERALKLAPDLVAIRLPYAETLVEAHRPRQALDMLDALPEGVRDERAAVLARASALGKLGDQPGEVAELRRLAALDPRHSATNLRLGHALRSLGDRLSLDEVRSFATLLQQSKELGTSLSGALRVFSDEMRHKRMSLAEEKAHALPAKMSVPVTVCILPVVLMIAIIPIIVKMTALD